MKISKKHAERCTTHHHACDCREYKAQEMEQALKYVRTLAQFDLNEEYQFEGALMPEDIIKLCDRVLNNSIENKENL